jgi:PIN domain nuclease of toxin-antitoxin system
MGDIDQAAIGRLDFHAAQFDQALAALAFAALNVIPAYGLEAGALPLHHKDPFDRMLIAQCRLEQLVLVSQILKCGPMMCPFWGPDQIM